MNFFLGVWKGLTAISDVEAARQYLILKDGESTAPEFDTQVYTFYTRLTDLYPEIDMLPEEELEDSPWACGIDMSGGHVILAIQPEKSEKLFPQVLMLAGQHGLVCFDPQAGKVHLPPHLRTSNSRTASRST
jgi:hypothetical protein